MLVLLRTHTSWRSADPQQPHLDYSSVGLVHASLGTDGHTIRRGRSLARGYVIHTVPSVTLTSFEPSELANVVSGFPLARCGLWDLRCPVSPPTTRSFAMERRGQRWYCGVKHQPHGWSEHRLRHVRRRSGGPGPAIRQRYYARSNGAYSPRHPEPLTTCRLFRACNDDRRREKTDYQHGMTASRRRRVESPQALQGR